MFITAMSRHPLDWKLLLVFAGAAVLFYFANRPAYKGYFSGDDFESLNAPTHNHALMSPALDEGKSRPVGDIYYHLMHRVFKLRYVPYVVVLQILHVLNVVLLFLLLRRLDIPQFAAAAGALFYCFHAATIETYWRPMFVFDVLCATLSLLVLLLYLRGHWLLALVPFWLAFKTKEIAVMLPFALLGFEWLVGERKWKRLIPYFVVSVWFGVQALWQNFAVAPDAPDALHFEPDLLWHSAAFYSSAIFFVPFAGLALLLLPVWLEDRRLRAGLLFLAAMFVPLLALPGQLTTGYWYIPMIGLAVAAAVAASKMPRWCVILFFVLWFPLNYVMLRDKRKTILAASDQARWLMTGLSEYARSVPPLKAVVYQSVPPFLSTSGVESAIHLAFGLNVDAAWYMSPKAQQTLHETPMALIGYYPVPHIVKGLLRTRDELSSYIRFADEMPLYQFGAGWRYDWLTEGLIRGRAEITLYRPRGATEFEMVCEVKTFPMTVDVLEDDVSLGSQTISAAGSHALRWKLGKANPGDKKITILTGTEDREVGIHAIGYVTP